MEETFKAIGGVLGEKSLKLWEEEKKEVLVKAFGELVELVELLETPVEEAKKVEH